MRILVPDPSTSLATAMGVFPPEAHVRRRKASSSAVKALSPVTAAGHWLDIPRAHVNGATSCAAFSAQLHRLSYPPTHLGRKDPALLAAGAFGSAQATSDEFSVHDECIPRTSMGTEPLASEMGGHFM